MVPSLRWDVQRWIRTNSPSIKGKSVDAAYPLTERRCNLKRILKLDRLGCANRTVHKMNFSSLLLHRT
jgi:hypothetical protein